jgi:hypothetical protein
VGASRRATRGGGRARPVLSTPLVPLLHSTSRHHPLSLFISFFTLFSFFPWLLSGSAPPFTNNAGFREVDEETKLKELNNGRLAMIAITGYAFNEAATKIPVFNSGS